MIYVSRFRLEGVYLSLGEVQYLKINLTYSTMSQSRGNRRNNTDQKHTRESDCIIEALALLKQLKLIMNLCRSLMSARHLIETLKEVPVNGVQPQPTKG